MRKKRRTRVHLENNFISYREAGDLLGKTPRRINDLRHKAGLPAVRFLPAGAGVYLNGIREEDLPEIARLASARPGPRGE